MPRFLSAEWAEAVATTVAGVDTGDARLHIRHVVGDVRYSLRIANGRVTADLDSDGGAEPDVVFTHDYETAAAINRGELSPQQAVLAGRLRVSGDPAALVRHADLLARVGVALEPLRSATTY